MENEALEQYPIALSPVMEMLYKSALSYAVITSHKWPLSTWNVANVSEELNF